MKESKLSGNFFELLKSPFKILSQNGKLTSITSSLYLILNSILFILFILSSNPFVIDLARKLMILPSTRPGTPEFTELFASIREDTGIYLGIEAAYIIFFFFTALFTQTAVVIIASSYYNGYDLSCKELVTKVSKTWTRPFVTSIWTQLLALGYTIFFILPFLVPSLVLFDHRMIMITVLTFLAIVVIALYVWLSVVWSLGVVVSVVEDSCGFTALARARELVKGKRVHGFVLNLMFLFVTVVVIVIGSKLSPLMPVVVGVVQVLLIGVISLFKFMAYSGYYFQCKNEKTKSGSLEYSPIPTAPVVDEDLP